MSSNNKLALSSKSIDCILPSPVSNNSNSSTSSIVLEDISDDEYDNDTSDYLDFKPSLLKYYRFLRSSGLSYDTDMTGFAEVIRCMRNTFDLPTQQCREHALYWLQHEKSIIRQIEMYDRAIETKSEASI